MVMMLHEQQINIADRFIAHKQSAVRVNMLVSVRGLRDKHISLTLSVFQALMNL